MPEIRAMGAADVAAVEQIEKESFSQPWSQQDFLEMLATDYAYYYVAIEDETIIGCCGFRNIAGEGEIVNVEVSPLHRQRGVGRELLKYTLQKAQEMGIQLFTLEVRVSNQSAIRLYESLGFRGEGIRPDFYEIPKEDALIMWKR